MRQISELEMRAIGGGGGCNPRPRPCPPDPCKTKPDWGNNGWGNGGCDGITPGSKQGNTAGTKLPDVWR